MTLFERILAARGLNKKSMGAFLNPDYYSTYDPFLLNDMDKAVKRLIKAHNKKEKIIIYGDYDIDGLTATTLLLDALSSFGFKDVEVFIPNRFIEGYGLNLNAIEQIAVKGTKLIITVDCGSVSEKEISRANELGLDVIVTDHHTMTENLPPAVAVINPKRLDNKYPFTDLAGVGVAFKLVQALQGSLKGLDGGQEKWLLDLVAIGTICDVVSLVGENRTLVYWGMKVLSQTRRPGLKALMAISGIDPANLTTRSIGFGLGPRMNAAGRLETAEHALDLLVCKDPMKALQDAEYLDLLNKNRRQEQEKIVKAACEQAEKYANDPVLVLSNESWNHGIVGIVASKIMEKYKKPCFILQEMGDETKGSARSYGDFSAIDAINSCKSLLKKGGGHKLAVGVTLATSDIAAFRKSVNDFYNKQQLVNQQSLLLPKIDTSAKLDELTEEVFDQICQLEPFGMGNIPPVLKSDNLRVVSVKSMGDNSQHIKMTLSDGSKKIDFLAFNAPEAFFVEPGETISVLYHLTVNEWRGNRSVKGQLLHLEPIEVPEKILY